MDIFLVVLFIVQGKLIEIDGYGPRIQPDITTCLSRAELLGNYIKIVPQLPQEKIVLCDTKKNIQNYIIKYNSTTI